MANYYRHKQMQNGDEIDENSAFNNIEQFIELLFTKDPELGRQLLNALTDSDCGKIFSTCALQLKYLYLHWSEVQNQSSAYLENDNIEKLLSLLACLHLPSSIIAKDIRKEIKLFYLSLLPILCKGSIKKFSKEIIYAASFRQNSDELLQCLNAAEMDYINNCFELSSPEKTELTTTLTSSFSFTDIPLCKFVLDIVFVSKNRESIWQELFAICCYRNLHVVDVIFVSINSSFTLGILFFIIT